METELIAIVKNKLSFEDFCLKYFNTKKQLTNDGIYTKTEFLSKVNNEPLNLHGDGNNIRDFLYIDDLIDAILLLISNGKYSEIYNIGVDNPLTIKELANIIIRKTNSNSLIKYVENRPYNDKRYYINCDKITELGWKPKNASASSFIKNLDVLISS